jgi:hypothetical protein
MDELIYASATALAAAQHLATVFGGWQRPPL